MNGVDENGEPEDIRHPGSHEAVAEEEAWRKVLRVKNATLAVVVVILVVVIAGFSAFLWVLLQQAKANHDVADQVRSCVEPTGECFKDSQARTADIVGIPRGPINTVTVLATYCQVTKGADTVPEILDCVDAQLQLLKGR